LLKMWRAIRFIGTCSRAIVTTAWTKKTTKKVPLGTKEIVATDFNPLKMVSKIIYV